MKYIVALLAVVCAQDDPDPVDTATESESEDTESTDGCDDYSGCFSASGKCADSAYWSGNTDSCPGTCECSEDTCENYSGCFTASGKCEYSDYWSGNTDSCPGTCECTEASCEDYSGCFTASGKCGYSDYWSGNTDSCPGTCECSEGSGSGSGYDIGADDIAAFKDSATSLIGVPCSATGEECTVEGDVCYGATITATDVNHPQYIQEYDSVIKEIAN